uniref:Uncharacterized protein n=1 Tax=Eutreptiella gymnastica TaxID=73025 RepID=A0A7S1I675_9EUGL|mmetsp:Transcript_133191/g.230965  ORF Transcript_133191/g.230965 Transcript_133191/m.230965 type:complete len:222 (+) Transcript_133191:42-707(+)
MYLVPVMPLGTITTPARPQAGDSFNHIFHREPSFLQPKPTPQLATLQGRSVELNQTAPCLGTTQFGATSQWSTHDSSKRLSLRSTGDPQNRSLDLDTTCPTTWQRTRTQRCARPKEPAWMDHSGLGMGSFDETIQYTDTTSSKYRNSEGLQGLDQLQQTWQPSRLNPRLDLSRCDPHLKCPRKSDATPPAGGGGKRVRLAPTERLVRIVGTPGAMLQRTSI